MFAFSCGERSKTLDNSVLVEVDYKSNDEIILSDYVKQVKIVRLETSDDVLLGEFIRRVQLFDNKLFVFDMQTNSLFVFTETGKFLYKIGSAGQGPGEYAYIMDFTVSEQGAFLQVSGSAGYSILHYDLEGRYIRTVAHNYMSLEFIRDNDNFLISVEAATGKRFQVALIDTAGALLKTFFSRPRDSFMGIWGRSNCFIYYDSLNKYFSPRHGNDFYKWNGENDWEKIVSLSFGDKTYTEDVAKLDGFGENDFPYILRDCAFIIGDMLIFDFFHKTPPLHHCFYNMRTGETKSGYVKNDLLPNYNRFAPNCQNGNRLIEVLQAEWILNGFPNFREVEPSLKNLSEDDNPVLIFYEFKN
jgi:hypothetical protein